MDSRAITAWMTAAMLLSQAPIGIFGVRRRILREPHIVLGLILPLLTCAHAWLSMKSANRAGLWFATAALLLLGVQALLGTALIRPSESPGSLKRVHLAVGLGILALASVHVLLIGK
jgi:heme A synthase